MFVNMRKYDLPQKMKNKELLFNLKYKFLNGDESNDFLFCLFLFSEYQGKKIHRRGFGGIYKRIHCSTLVKKYLS